MNKSFFAVVFGVLVLGLAGCAVVGDEAPGTEANEIRQTCGGIAGIACPDGYECVDNPRDDCDPANGGADCGGICKRARRNRCDYSSATKTYISRSADECAAIHFLCADGATPFFDECGCGCEKPAGEACGSTTCAAGQVCCNASCGICTEPGGFCTEQFCSSETR